MQVIRAGLRFITFHWYYTQETVVVVKLTVAQLQTFALRRLRAVNVYEFVTVGSENRKPIVRAQSIWNENTAGQFNLLPAPRFMSYSAVALGFKINYYRQPEYVHCLLV